MSRGPGRPRKYPQETENTVSDEAEQESSPRQTAKERAEAIRQRRGVRHNLGVNFRLQGAQYEAREGFVNRWVNDYDARVAEFKEMGWEPVVDENGEPKTKVVGMNPRTGQGGMDAYLMEIPEEIHEEYAQEKREQIVDTTKSRTQTLQEGEYVPKGYESPLSKDKPSGFLR